MLATGGSSAGDTVVAEGGDGVGEAWQEWDASALADLGVPVIQAVCATASRAAWEESDSGLAPLDAATQVAIPEFDGRLLGGVDLVQGARRRAARGSACRAALRARPRALRAALRGWPCAPRGCARCPPRDARVAVAADELPDQARQGRHGGRPRHAGERAASCFDALRGRRHAGRAALRRRRRADARADRGRRPRRRVPHRRAARRLAAAAAGRATTSRGTRSCPSRCARRWRSAGARRRATATSTATTS